MKSMNYLQPLEAMERISRKEIGENLDEYIARIDKEDIGFVITDKGKPDLVLCPARWFEVVFDDDFGCMVNSAVRYSLGRNTYMPSVSCNFVRRYLPLLDIKTITNIVEDIDRETADEKLPLRAEWIALRDELKAQLSNMAVDNK